MYFALYPLIAYSLSRIQAVEEESPKKQPLITDTEKTFNMPKLFLVPRFTFGLISQVIVYSAVTFLQPILSLHLEEFGYQAVFIGFSFAIPTLIYASTSPLIYILTSNLKKSGVICLGYIVVCLSFFLIGPS